MLHVDIVFLFVACFGKSWFVVLKQYSLLNSFSRYYMSLKVGLVSYDLPLRTRKQLVPILSLRLLLLSFKGAAVIGLRCCGFTAMC